MGFPHSGLCRWDTEKTMLRSLLNLLTGRGKYHSLIKDTHWIIDDATSRFQEEQLHAIANEVARHLQQSRAWLERPNMTHRNVFDHLKRQHQEARRTHRDRDLSVYTLAIIYFRADVVGHEADAAKAVIEQFIAKWATHGEDTTAPPT